jgi:cytochrome c oxidase assembly factor CtaG
MLPTLYPKHHNRPAMLPDAHSGLHSWALPIVVTPALFVVGLVYVQGWYRLQRALPNVLGLWQLVAFMSGLFSLWVAVGSPLAALDHEFLTVHMVQHLLQMTVAAPLILLGAPVITLLNALPPPLVNGVLRPLVRCSLVHKLGTIVAHPVFCWLAATSAVIGWHLPSLFELGLQSEAWHGVEQACFFAAGLLFWWPVVEPWPSLAGWPRWSIPLYLFLATLPCDALSAFLAFCGRVVYSHYLSSHRAFSISALSDQECAGALMWVCVTFAYLAPAAAVTIRILSPHGRSSKTAVL